MTRIFIFPLFILLNLLFAVQSQSQSAWVVEANDIDPNNYYGVTVANGVIGIVSSADPLKVSDVILNGVYDNYQRGRVSNILKTFNHLNMDMDVDGVRVNRNNISNYSQALNMQDAILETHFDVGDKISVKSEMMALRHLPYSALHVITLTAKSNVSVTAISEILTPDHLSDVRNYYSEIDRPHVLIPLMTSVANSPSGNIKVAASNSFIFSEDHGNEPRLIHEDWDYNRHLTKFNKSLNAGDSYTFAVIATTCASTQYADPQNESERLSIYAKLEGLDRLLNRHKQAWKELWKSNITIDGDIDLTRDIRFALYHLYSFARKGTSYSLSPMGLSGLGYNGHVFWDTELWMYPPLLMMQPEIAKSLLEYRYERLEAARNNAYAHGYEGAMFPWESADDGSEDTPVWALTGPFEQHISGCIAWAFWKYFQLTGDEVWLKERAYPLISEVANFWASRVEREGPGNYHIRNVVAADEWAENVDDNAFTNAVAILSLRYATEAALILGLEPNSDWEEVANNIPILKFDNGVTKEHETYDGEMIKQADVNLLAYPLEFIKEREQIKKDLEYYSEKISPNGPAMGSAILSVLNNRLGETERAKSIFLKSYKLNEVPPFGVLSETAGGTNPYFATGAGGLLQAVLSGFGGLGIDNKGLTKSQSSIPSGWNKLIITGVGIDEETVIIE